MVTGYSYWFRRTILVFILHIGACLRGCRLLPCARLLAFADRVDIIRTFNGNLYFDINECIVCPVGKVVCFLRDLVKDIKASAIVGLFVRLCENIIRLGNRDRDGGVIDLDDFFARFILDAGTGVGGLGCRRSCCGGW